MSIKFILGRSGSGKTDWLLNDIRSKLFAEPLGKPIIYLVPDQMTFGAEYELIKTPDLAGMIRAQVFSFSRLAWRVLQETGGMARHYLSSSAIQMMLRKLVEEHKQDLKVFMKASDKSGFISQLEAMLTEFKRYCLSPAELEQYLSNARTEVDQKALTDKLHDLAVLYMELEKSLSEKYVDSEDYLRLLAEKAEASSYLESAELYIDGFHSFTPQEYEVIEALMKKAGSVTIALTADNAYSAQLPQELDLFRMTGATYYKLLQLAENAGKEINEPIILKETPRFKASESISHLEQNYDGRPTVEFSDSPDITLLQASNRRAEIEGIAREIQAMMKKNKYRYRDIALLVRNTNQYEDLIEQVFKDYEIPFFIDQKRSMLNHPLIELIRSSLEVINGNWQYESVFRCIKTELLFSMDANKKVLREEMDQFENYVLSYGIKGQRWTKDERFRYRRFYSLEDEYVVTDEEREMEEKINRLRELVVTPLQLLQKRLKRSKTGRELAESLYLYLEELHIPEKLEQLRSERESAGQLLEAREHDQVWQAVITLLDEFVEMLADQKLSMKLFSEMLETGFEAMKFSLVPPAIDQVLIADIERSRFFHIKCTFIIGVNDGIIPARPKEEGILSEDDRELLHHQGIQLAPTAKQQLLDENFIIYLALASPSEKLFLSYPIADEEGKSLLPSIIIKRIEDMFPKIAIEKLINEPEELDEEEQLSFLVNEDVALSYLTAQLQAWKRGYPVHPIWWDTYNYFISSDEKEKTSRVLSSLYFENKEQHLVKETSHKLYGKHIQGSVSRMEQFNSCAFAHFASHGLKLKERQVFKLEAPDIGDMFHAALKHISDRLHQLKLDWKTLTKDQCEKLSIDAVEKLAPKLQREILLSSNRHHYIKRKLQKIVARASTVLSEHAKASGFAPIGLELGFGKGGELPPMHFTLPNGCTMEVIGRIDRVDKADSSRGTLLRIVDYKSSDKSLQLTEVYYGLALQMLTYLDIVISNSKLWLGMETTPAGVLYFHVHDPIVSANSLLDEEDLDDEIFKKFKMKGLLLGDEEAIQLMDQQLQPGGTSKIVSARLLKKGGLGTSSSITSEEEFHILRNFVRNEFQKIGTHITDGIIDIAPYKLKDKTPCTYCAYKSVCQFDESLEENNYRALKNEKKEDVLEKMREEVNRV
ncbi:helicase-exonuclease AddAB subunit AddB [Metabacillus fastidiosus]|uniref:ATP-dependent helicase/deoxyribonuclease subunit B n=1 Tax=Metabacillus fastidiosus TaxID=1458 RepID=A0ABU6P217_9BACI|nr:helicase-exonuclease AddAB subunit AddB [Metabacillus fastidiosus]MED4403120.1 helicase-exonuclease AddAB subunit AddB [Metabacillus fastidiosus]MED4461545.1 helicase-exonuclease AddAB subunit AddB [Metabacillus fastidiosus]